MAIEMVNPVFAGRTCKFFGDLNLQDGIAVVAGITPIGAGLHDPVLICWPFVIGKFGTVAQKLMKLFVDVREATWPASGVAWPLFAKPLAMTEGSRVKDV